MTAPWSDQAAKARQQMDQQQLLELVRAVQKCVLSERTGASAVVTYIDRDTMMVGVHTIGWEALEQISQRMLELLQAGGLEEKIAAAGYGLAWKPN